MSNKPIPVVVPRENVNDETAMLVSWIVPDGDCVEPGQSVAQIETSKAFLMSFGGKFNPQMVEDDVIKLEVYYRSNGYRNVHVAR